MVPTFRAAAGLLALVTILAAALVLIRSADAAEDIARPPALLAQPSLGGRANQQFRGPAEHHRIVGELFGGRLFPRRCAQRIESGGISQHRPDYRWHVRQQ